MCVLGPVVQRLDNAIHRINVNKTNHAIHWIVIYPVDSVIQPLNNRGLMFISKIMHKDLELQMKTVQRWFNCRKIIATRLRLCLHLVTRYGPSIIPAGDQYMTTWQLGTLISSV